MKTVPANWRDQEQQDAVEAERERCAKIAERPTLWTPPSANYDHFPANTIHLEAGRAIADAIRKSE